jgi:chitosanase
MKTPSKNKQRKIQAVINVFETGSPEGDYSAVSVMADGPADKTGPTKQITYGRAQTTEFSNLAKLIGMYIEANGQYSKDLKPYLALIGKRPSLYEDSAFVRLLKMAGQSDPVMHQCQDQFFDTYYFQPALLWWLSNGFASNLGLLIVYDSFIHSGGVPIFLRKRFPARTPLNGGNEYQWLLEYTQTRHQWLASHANRLLRKTIYRTTFMLDLLHQKNHSLKGTLNVRGVLVK